MEANRGARTATALFGSNCNRVPGPSALEIFVEPGRDASDKWATFSRHDETVAIQFKQSSRIVKGDGTRLEKKLLAGFAEAFHQIDLPRRRNRTSASR